MSMSNQPPMDPPVDQESASFGVLIFLALLLVMAFLRWTCIPEDEELPKPNGSSENPGVLPYYYIHSQRSSSASSAYSDPPPPYSSSPHPQPA